MSSWWSQSYLCQGTMTRKPCQECLDISNNTNSLSKHMFDIESDSQFLISPQNRNPSLLWINGEQACHHRVPRTLQIKDIISIGTTPQHAWMKFVLAQFTIVTPETEHSTRQCNSLPRRSLFSSAVGHPRNEDDLTQPPDRIIPKEDSILTQFEFRQFMKRTMSSLKLPMVTKVPWNDNTQI